jgi:hypothetical protein
LIFVRANKRHKLLQTPGFVSLIELAGRQSNKELVVSKCRESLLNPALNPTLKQASVKTEDESTVDIAIIRLVKAQVWGRHVQPAMGNYSVSQYSAAERISGHCGVPIPRISN